VSDALNTVIDTVTITVVTIITITTAPAFVTPAVF